MHDVVMDSYQHVKAHLRQGCNEEGVGVFRYLVRAWIASGHYVLVAHDIGADVAFLPGGRIEYGEPARDALQREIMEKIGVLAQIGDFVGACEAVREQDGRLYCEINLVFACHVPGVDKDATVKSLEDNLEFLWIPKKELASINLIPEPMRKLAEVDTLPPAFWGSDLE
ncbi:MAG: NUDIX domain-containing protein [Firmicutes bacterium]|jgi:8-oxo-dGTP pyrophosphatase MutT (NUDIX family)|nr:NUDIX domain-containing protein [Bacillota bacterium]